MTSKTTDSLPCDGEGQRRGQFSQDKEKGGNYGFSRAGGRLSGAHTHTRSDRKSALI